MKLQHIFSAALAAILLNAATAGVQAQRAGNMSAGAQFGQLRGVPAGGALGGGNVVSSYFYGDPLFAYGFYGANPGYMGAYGGYYGFSDPTIAVTPFGIQPLGYGYNGYTGTGAPDWEILRSAYEQGYRDATMAAANANATPDTGDEPESANATPANSRAVTVTRVPHGSDSVRMWRVGKSQIALRWQGDPRIVAGITFELTDSSGKTLRRTTVSQLPAEVRFVPPPNARYYQVNVRYIDGAANTIVSPLPKQ